MGFVVTVSGAVGGIGASTLAYALALQGDRPSVLIDVQADGAPLDVVLGSESVPGARWSQVRVQSDVIDAAAILTALPEFHGIHVLSADRDGVADPTAVQFLVGALREACDLVVLDIPARHPLARSIDADLHVLVLPPTIMGIGGTLTAPLRPALLVAVDVGSADIAATALGGYLDHEVLGVVRWQRAVTAAASACVPPPATCDVMRVASQIMERLHDDA